MEVVAQIIRNRLLGGELELHSSYEPIVQYINYRTPTAYGNVRFVDLGEACDISFGDGLAKETIVDLIADIQRRDNYNIQSRGELADFVRKGEELLRVLHGGSAGQVLLLKNTATGDQFVRKVAARFGVEGNGSPKLQAEAKFLAEIERRPACSALTKLYPRVLDYSETRRFITLDQEYIGEGQNVFTALSRSRIVAKEHSYYFDVLLSALIPYGYALSTRLVPEPESLEQLEDYYLRRSEARVRFLQNCGDFVIDFPTNVHTSLSELIRRRHFTINGITYQNPLEIISRIRVSAPLANVLRPRTEYFCVHGDMTFLNMVFDSKAGAYRLIDNRGYIGNWDALYDFGKLKFTLSGFGNVMLDELVLSEDEDQAFTLELTGNRRGRWTVRALNESFFDGLLANEEFPLLIKSEPYWRERILFAESIHYLADIPHRLLLDQSAKHAVAVFLLGTMYLNKLYDALI